MRLCFVCANEAVITVFSIHFCEEHAIKLYEYLQPIITEYACLLAEPYIRREAKVRQLINNIPIRKE
jgi:hypothetical protein